MTSSGPLSSSISSSRGFLSVGSRPKCGCCMSWIEAQQRIMCHTFNGCEASWRWEVWWQLWRAAIAGVENFFQATFEVLDDGVYIIGGDGVRALVGEGFLMRDAVLILRAS